MIRRVFAIILAICAISGLAGCGAEADEQYDLRDGMRSMSQYLDDESNIVDIDVDTLSDFFSAVDVTKYRLRGMVTNYKAENNILGNYMVSCDLFCEGFLEDMIVTVIFDDEETTSDGEYIEIVGDLFGLGYGGYSNKASFAIGSAHIVERGASVREQIEQEE